MSIRAETGFSLADQLFNRESVSRLGAAIGDVERSFDPLRFRRRVLKPFAQLTLKQRIDHIVTVLGEQLPDDYQAALEILRAALPPPLDPTLGDDDFGDFIWVTPGEFAARHGCRTDRLSASLEFLREATQRFSSEAAIRPFLRDFPDVTMEFVHQCAQHENYHVRRLASEGIRPRLPWALRVELPVGEVLAVLDRLYTDPTRYVTRSVANNLNDLARYDADAVIARLRRWRRAGRQQAAELDWMTRHALRSLLKEGHADALELLGFPSRPEFSLHAVDVSETVRLGESLQWRATLRSRQQQKLRLALRVYFLRANGSHSSKVFAIGDFDLAAGESLPVEKCQPFRAITTRTLYPGRHYAELLVNGVARGKRGFDFTG